ncbi:hypothetical protein [Tranquillimonas alkanivorans]|uniref:Uncharacterized protein n=1 Tax=Tranquillimonas alkanivorans TaxID=441119 RepID=A0A1I5RMZ7_9RHOB|nr:hypothetical protein [Tranquillimonas alkanivorans]SFP59924.1 hypothetical protein SAMN04488047_1097 [Tranquillimonas alkanivorans]
MLNIAWLLRASRWARNPPSAKRVKLVVGVIAVCVALFAIERLVGWPDWLTVNGPSRGVPLR